MRRNAYMGACVAALLLTPTLAWAQEPAAGAPAPQAGEEGAGASRADDQDVIVVTARKRAESLQEVPASVTAFSGDRLQELGRIESAGELALVTPGVTFVDTGNLNAELSIRGAGAATVRVANVDSPIAVLRDGASVVGGNIGGRTFTRSDLFDIERVEIIRGPQGSIFGVNAVGGVLNALTARPQQEFGFRASSYYNFSVDEIGGEAVLNAPITDKLAVRLGGQYENRTGGYFENVFTENAGDVNRYAAGRFSVLWEPTSTFDAFLTFDGSQEIGASNRVRTVSLQVPDPDGPYTYGSNTSDRTERDQLTGTLRLNWQSPVGKFTSITFWRDRETDFFQDEDGTFPGYNRAPTSNAGGVCNDRACVTRFFDDTRRISQELRFERDFGAVDVLAGADIAFLRNNFYIVSSGRRTSAANAAPSPGQNNAQVTLSEDTPYGAFGSIGWDATDRLRLDATLRWNATDKTQDAAQIRRGAGAVAPCAFDQFLDEVAAYTPACIVLSTSLEDRFTNFAPAASASYEILENLRTFFSYARGYRSGGFNGSSVFSPDIPESFDEENTNAYEFGFKGELGWLNFSASYFRNQFDNLISTAQLDVAGTTRNFRINSGQAFTQGVDLEAYGAIRNLLGGTLSYTTGVNWLDGKFTEGQFEDAAVEGAPKWQLTATAVYRRPITETVSLFLSATYRGQRGGLTNTANITNDLPLDDIDLFDGNIGVEWNGLRVTLEGSNLLDQRNEILRDPLRTVYGDKRGLLLRATYAFGSER